MKKILLLLWMLITTIGFSQTMYLKVLKVGDSIYIPAGHINAQNYYQNGVLKVFADTSLLMHRYDSTDFVMNKSIMPQISMKVITCPITSVPVWIKYPHGIDWRNIIGMNAWVKHDSNVAYGWWLTRGTSQNYSAAATMAWNNLSCDSLNVAFYVTGTALLDDTVFVTITYRNSY